MTAPQLIALLVVAAGISSGQILFKIASRALDGGFSVAGVWALATNLWFLAALALYGLMTLLWVWVLSGMDLSRAYPFAALSFVFTPVLAALFLREGLTLSYGVGMALIVGGLVVITR